MKYANRSAVDILNAAYEELHGESLDLSRLLRELLLDCGADGAGLCLQDFIDAFNDNECPKLFDVQFACSACIAMYYASNECSNIEFVRSLAAMFILSNCIRRGYGDWERSFDFMIGILDANKQKCNFTIRMDAIRIAICNNKAN